ncbi:glutamate--tRNA ligase [Marinicaulis aureus]|uniref:Glutamate--tRNA ligase n=1 Tax=Hyphococcus aureus TaxID=2666033 RepID=A0ABW1L339_9PROT
MADNQQPVVTRFAPSPTGYLHIGGARTALFNWLYARGRGGKFLLRIEDTDRARHTPEAVQAIIDGLTWLGLDWDGEPVSQYEQAPRHVEIANQLLAEGKAYRCYLTPDEITAARDQARADGVRFESKWRDADPATAPDAPFSIRFKAPRDGETIVEDAVQGRVAFPNSAIDDLIILRSDGGPTYNLAVVVDDHDMGVTHVIRGDDHLNNAARQTQIYQALGWPLPVFAHIPLIHGSDGSKLSKRHGALGVEAYRDQGYLPEGLFNYLLRLGWAHGDEEIIPYEKAKQLFDLKGINKAPARLDLDKLNHVNAHYVAALSDEEFVRWAAPFLQRAGIDLDTDNMARLQRSAAFLKTRCATLADVVAASEFLFLTRPLAIEGKAAKPLHKEGATAILNDLNHALSEEAVWASPETLDETLQAFAAAKNVGFGVVGPPARAALTAGRPSPGLGEVLYGLGRDESRSRLADQA